MSSHIAVHALPSKNEGSFVLVGLKLKEILHTGWQATQSFLGSACKAQHSTASST